MITVPSDVDLAQIGRDVLVGSSASGAKPVMVFRAGALVVVAEDANSVVSVAVVLDDRAGQLTEAHGDAWRQWLRLSNALAMRDWPTTITTVSRVDAGHGAAIAPAPAEEPGVAALSEPWAEAYAQASPGPERELVMALAAYSELEVPTIGAEGPDGIPLDVAWPDSLTAVDVHGTMPDQDHADLLQAGWSVLSADAETIVRELQRVATGGEG